MATSGDRTVAIPSWWSSRGNGSWSMSTTEEQRAKHVQAVARYNQTAKGHATRKRALTRYNHSEKGYAVRKQYRLSEKGRAAKARYRQTPESRAAGTRWAAEYRAQHPERARAHRLLQQAVRRGRIQKPDHCSSCGRGVQTVGHHHDYA